MRPARPKTPIKTFILTSIVFLLPALLRALDPCAKAKNAWITVSAYQCTYRAVTSHEGKQTESRMKYTWQKPGKIRMDIQEPQDGAVLIYNPQVSPKVKVRPFPKLRGFVLKYNLTDKRVSSDSGGTIDRSDLGHRIAEVCKEFEKPDQKVFFDDNGLLSRIEKTDAKGAIVEIFEWRELLINPQVSEELFKKF